MFKKKFDFSLNQLEVENQLHQIVRAHSKECCIPVLGGAQLPDQKAKNYDFWFFTFSVMGHIFDAHKKQENCEGPIFTPPAMLSNIGYPIKKLLGKRRSFCRVRALESQVLFSFFNTAVLYAE